MTPAADGASMAFHEYTVEVFTGCNRGSGGVEVTDSTVTFGPIAITLMACEGAAGEFEAALLPVLTGEFDYVIEGQTLTLTSGTTEIILGHDADRAGPTLSKSGRAGLARSSPVRPDRNFDDPTGADDPRRSGRTPVGSGRRSGQDAGRVRPNWSDQASNAAIFVSAGRTPGRPGSRARPASPSLRGRRTRRGAPGWHRGSAAPTSSRQEPLRALPRPQLGEAVEQGDGLLGR